MKRYNTISKKELKKLSKEYTIISEIKKNKKYGIQKNATSIMLCYEKSKENILDDFWKLRKYAKNIKDTSNYDEIKKIVIDEYSYINLNNRIFDVQEIYSIKN